MFSRALAISSLVVFPCLLPLTANAATPASHDVAAESDIPVMVTHPVETLKKPRTFGFWWSLHSKGGGLSAGVVFGMSIAAIILCIFVVEVLRGRHAKKDLYTNAVTWGIFLIITAAGHVQSPQDDPSIYITIAAAMQLLAMIILVASSSSPHFPVEFGILMALALALRVSVTSMFVGYLPVDQTGDGCIQVIEGITLLMVLYGLWRQFKAPVYTLSYRLITSRLIVALVVCVAGGLTCYGDLDFTREYGRRPDQKYAACMYMELAAWFFMLHFQITVHQQSSSAWLLPAIIQAVCRSYYWCLALQWGLIAPMKPVLLQHFFPKATVIVHITMSATLTFQAVFANMDMSKPLLTVEDTCLV